MKLNWALVDRFFAGEADAKETALVEKFLQEAPAFRMLVSHLYRGSETAIPDAVVKEAQDDVMRRLELDVSRAAFDSARPCGLCQGNRKIGPQSCPICAGSGLAT